MNTSARWPDRIFWMGLIVLCAFVYSVHYIFILNHFYELGAFWNDSGWLASLIYHSEWPLINPKAGGPVYHPKSFFICHTSFIFIPFNWLSQILPVGRVEWYANFQGIVYATCALGAGVCARGLLTASQKHITTIRHALLALGLAAVFSFNGIIWASIGIPHFEMLICGLILLFLHNLLRYTELGRIRSIVWMVILWILLISVREDAGFHLAAILLIVCTYYLFTGISFKKWQIHLLWALGSVLASLLLMLWQKTYFPGDDALGRVYLGDPPLNHLRQPLLAERLGMVVIYRSYIWLPWVLLGIVALYFRNIMATVGLLAFAPWFWLSVLAASESPGSLKGYYAYPLFLGQAWILLSSRFEGLYSAANASPAKWHFLSPLLANKLSLRASLLWASLIGLAGFGGYWASETLLFNYHSKLLVSVPKVDYASHEKIRNLVESGNLPAGKGLVDWGVASLFPDYFSPQDFLSEEYKGNRNWALFYSVGNMAAGYRSHLWKNGFSNIRILGNTRIAIATKLGTELPPEWEELAGPPIGLLQLALTTGDALVAALSNSRVASNVASKDWQFFGPHWALEPGTYRFEAEIEWEALTEKEGYVLYYDIVGPSRTEPLYHLFITEYTGQPRKGTYTLTHEFTLTAPVANFEFRHHTTGQVRTWLNRAELVRVK